LNPDGTFKWGALPHAVGFSSPSVGVDGTIYIAGYAVNPDGTVKWANPGTFSSPSIGPDGTIYGSVGADGNGVYAIKPDGTVQWTFPAKTTGVTIGSDATVYFGSSGILYALTPNGTVKWSFTVGFTGCPPYLVTLISACDPVIGSNGTVYIGSADGYLYAIG
jgi:outer membrane protein assembly factor BamB